MKWAFTIKQKSRAALILGVVFLLILGKNWLDERNVATLGNSFASVYEDRLVAESYIYQLSDHLYQKKIMIDNCTQQNNPETLAKIEQHNAAINDIIRNYEKTKLTTTETTYFTAFKQNVTAIEGLENKYLQGGQTPSPATKTGLDKRYEIVVKNLHELSGIQVAEGKILNDRSKQIIAGSSILTQFELAILIGLGLLIQALIFAAKSAIPKKAQNFSLN